MATDAPLTGEELARTDDKGGFQRLYFPRKSSAELCEVKELLHDEWYKAMKRFQVPSDSRCSGQQWIVEHQPGSVIGGPEVWLSGRYLVLSGEADVVARCSDNSLDTTIATLKRCNSFGWVSDGSPLDQWDSLCVRIVVSGDVPLKLCSTGQPDHKTVNNVGHGRLTELETLTRRVAELWLTTSPPPVGVGVQPSGFLRTHFLAGLWAPLLHRFDDHTDEIRRRREAGYRPPSRFPLQGFQIAELKNYVMHLTEIWYGSEKGGNLSAFYRWFLNAVSIVGVTAYSMDDIPMEASPDGWGVVIDASSRSKALKNRGALDESYQASGGMKQKQGRSAIDNTVLANVFTAAEARLLLVGRRLRKLFCTFLAFRQYCILKRFSRHLHINLLPLASLDASGREHGLVREILMSLSEENFSLAGVNPDSFCFQNLKARGSVLSGFGQLDPHDQKVMWEYASSLLLTESDRKDGIPDEESEDLFDRLVLWCRKYPGEYFMHDRMRHYELMLAGMWSNKVVLVKRSGMEQLQMARFFAWSWERTQPLWAVFAGGPPKELRGPGSKEVSRVRANECPYAHYHGISLPSGGFAQDKKQEGTQSSGYSMMMEAQWVQDPAANVENWFLTDIEKIVREAWNLNPHGPKSMMLRGEMFVNVGQNPKVGSSIKKTQHTQLSEASLAKYPLMRVSSSHGPTRSDVLDAYVDFVDIGPVGAAVESCGFFMKITTARPANPVLIKFLVELRLNLLTKFGGAEALDFFVTAISDECGGFVVLFAPLPQIEKLGQEPADLARWRNPSTGETSLDNSVEEGRLDYGKAVGNFLSVNPSLREQVLKSGEDTLRKLWAFNRVKGVREFVQEFAKERGIFEEVNVEENGTDSCSEL